MRGTLRVRAGVVAALKGNAVVCSELGLQEMLIDIREILGQPMSILGAPL